MTTHLDQVEVRRIFDACCLADSADEWARIMENECKANVELRKAVQELFEADVECESFLESSPYVLLAEGIGDEHKATQPLASDGSMVGTKIASYKLREQIGEGGFGVVYVAEQEEPVVRKVALKVIKPGMDTKDVIARFEAERQTLALMDHPNIAKVHDAGATDAGRPYFVMELVHGTKITEFCDNQKLDMLGRLQLFVDVCRAVQHAHQKGVIHRDLKPSNILVTIDGDRPLPKVIDFGISKSLSQKLTNKTVYTAYGQVVGTPLYMSPEQTRFDAYDIDIRSDVYSLGVLLYELLTGTTPFDKETVKKSSFDEMQRMIREVDPPRPSVRVNTLQHESLSTISDLRKIDARKLGRKLRQELDWIVMKALEKDRNRRYESASALVADIERFLADEPVEACPPSVAYRMQKMWRRRRGLIAATALIVLSLVGGIVTAASQAIRATRAEREAIENAKAARAAAEQEAEQRQRAEEKEKIAQNAAKSARRVLSFVQNRIFAAARPKGTGVGLGRDITLRQALDVAVPYIREGAEHPTTEALLRMTAGRSYLMLGETQIALRELKTARRLYEQSVGLRDSNALRCISSLAEATARNGDPTAALKMLKEILPLQESLPDGDQTDVWATREGMAHCYKALGQTEEALSLYEQIVNMRMAKLGQRHPSTLMGMHNLATAYQGLDRNREALAIFEKTLALRKSVLGESDLNTIETMNNIAVCYEVFGRFDDALRFSEHVFKVKTEVLGESHPSTLKSAMNLAMTWEELGRLEQALPLFEKTLRLQRKKVGDRHPDTLLTLSNLGNCYLSMGRVTDAVNSHEECLRVSRDIHGTDHRESLRTMVNLANAHYMSGRRSEALELREQAFGGLKEELGLDHTLTLLTMGNLGRSYLAAERAEEAHKLFDQLLSIRKKKLGSDHPLTLDSAWLVVVSLDALKRTAEAIPLLDDTLRRAKGKRVNPDLVPTMLSMRNNHFAKEKDIKRIRETVLTWESRSLKSADDFYWAACYRAFLANVILLANESKSATEESKKECDIAMKWLQKAVAAGWNRTEHTERDSDLRALRERPDFQELLRSMRKHSN